MNSGESTPHFYVAGFATAATYSRRSAEDVITFISCQS